MKITFYLKNCFLLLIPILVWNVAFAEFLPKGFSPDVFWKDIPVWVSFPENTLRILVMAFPAFMKLGLNSKSQIAGLWIYLVGVTVYFFSWLALMIFPESSWGQSGWGFTAPAYTTMIWFVGIGLLGSEAFFRLSKVSVVYISLSFLFVLFHTIHAYLVFDRL
jgi:hypothetical protein